VTAGVTSPRTPMNRPTASTLPSWRRPTPTDRDPDWCTARRVPTAIARSATGTASTIWATTACTSLSATPPRPISGSPTAIRRSPPGRSTDTCTPGSPRNR